MSFRIENWYDGQFEMRGKIPVALIAAGYAHDSAGPVTSKHIVGNPDGHLLAIDRIYGEGARESAGHFFPFRSSDQLQSAKQPPANVRFYFLALLVACKLSHQFIFGSQHQKGHPIDRVHTGCEDINFLLVIVFSRKETVAPTGFSRSSNAVGL